MTGMGSTTVKEIDSDKIDELVDSFHKRRYEEGWNSRSKQTEAGEELIKGMGGQPYDSWRKHRED